MASRSTSESALPANDPETRRADENDAMPPEDVGRALNRISFFTRKMRMLSMLTLSSVVAGVCCLGLVIYFGHQARISSSSYTRELAQFSVIWSIGPCFAGIFALVVFEATRRRGEVYFEEVSNELQWGIATKQQSDAPREKPSLSYRIVLREFVQAADLPLVPGKFGPAIYAATLLALTLASVITWSNQAF